MTRDEAIEKVRRAASTFALPNEWIVDALANLGLLKFDEPNPFFPNDDALSKAIRALHDFLQRYPLGSAVYLVQPVDILNALDMACLKIVEKD